MLPEKSFIRVNQQRDIRYRSTRLGSLCYLLPGQQAQRPGLAGGVAVLSATNWNFRMVRQAAGGDAAASKQAEHELNALTP